MATATAARTETRTDDEIQRDVLEELKWDIRLRSWAKSLRVAP